MNLDLNYSSHHEDCEVSVNVDFIDLDTDAYSVASVSYLDEGCSSLSTVEEETLDIMISYYKQHGASSSLSLKPAKKRKRASTYLPRPKVYRLVKQDLRRNYCTMFINVLNSYDYVTLKSFFDRYAASNLQLKKTFCMIAADETFFNELKEKAIEEKMILNEKMCQTAIGIEGNDLITAFIHGVTEATPDKVYTIDSDIKVHHRSDTRRSHITCQSRFRATVINNLPLKDVLDDVQHRFGAKEELCRGEHLLTKLSPRPLTLLLDASNNNHKIAPYSAQENELHDFVRYRRAKLSHMVTAEPFTISVLFQFHLITDEDRRIESIHMEGLTGCGK